MSRDEDITALLNAAVSEEVPTKQQEQQEEDVKELTQSEFLIKIFNLLDVKLNLYFTSHSASADLDKLLLELSRMVHKKLTIGVILQILYIYPGSFKVSETTNGRYLINLPESRLDGMESRKLKFAKLINQWVRINGDEEAVPCGVIDEEVVNDPLNNRVKVIKNSNKRLKNNSADFNFKEKVEQDKSLTLLQRIKLKEQQKKDEVGKDRNVVDSKLESIYNILYSLQITNKTSNYTLLNMTQKIKDSYKTSIHEDDVLQSLKKLAKLLAGVEVVEVKGLKVVRMDKDKLNRDQDLHIIRSL